MTISYYFRKLPVFQSQSLIMPKLTFCFKCLSFLKFPAFFLLLATGFVLNANAQNKCQISGKVTNAEGNPVEMAGVGVFGMAIGTLTAMDGTYSLELTGSQPAKLVFSCIGYINDTLAFLPHPGEKLRLNLTLKNSFTQLGPVIVEDKSLRTTNLQRLDARAVAVLPSASMGLEALVKTLQGVVSNNELSSQYSVRGGSYDENLIYVNDIEIYRPFLVRSGQQEGLSFLNSDLVSSLLFSSGGFEAKYGDKMSSVLDVKYKRPTAFNATAMASLLGASFAAGDAFGKGKFTYLLGARYKTNRYLMKTLDTQGDYQPRYFDFQSLVTGKVSPKTEISILGYTSRNSYMLIPASRDTKFGTLNETYNLRVYFEGQEVDRYNSSLGAVTVQHQLSSALMSKLILSAYGSAESEAFDILGEYYLAEIDGLQSTDDSLVVIDSKGYGGYLNHARNNLNVSVLSAENRWLRTGRNSNTQWGVKGQREVIHDKLSEWQLVDSAGFSMPLDPDMPGFPGHHNDFLMDYVYKAKVDLITNRISGFVQHTWSPATDSSKWQFTAGLRGQYWDGNRQLLFSPRVSASYHPRWKRDILFRASTGMYDQPPFYREMRRVDGSTNRDLKAQRSVQAVFATDWDLKLWDRHFKWVTEAFGKYLWDLVPYEVDNVKIRYMGENESHGYAYGIDTKLNGEFVKGLESWASLSFLKTAEDLLHDSYYIYYDSNGKEVNKPAPGNASGIDSALMVPGFIPRPTDQRFTFSLFFQDFLPMNPTFKVYMGMYFGSGLPTGAPKSPYYTHVLRMPAYRRVDLGLSKQFIGGEALHPAQGVFHHFRSLWVTLEILNLLQINNTVSYTWVRDVNNHQYAVPNYLTTRQVNLKLSVDF